MLPVALSTPIVAMTLTEVANALSPTVREGKCELAEQLFPNHNPGPGSLKQVPVPEPTDLRTYVRNRDAAIALGKAFFRDGSRGSRDVMEISHGVAEIWVVRKSSWSQSRGPTRGSTTSNERRCCRPTAEGYFECPQFA
jgi:hypothetical protein